MIGGGAKSSLWPQIVADVLNIPIMIPEQKESACAGAAILAGMGYGVYASIEEAAEKFTGKMDRIEPHSKNVDLYERLYKDFFSYLECV